MQRIHATRIAVFVCICSFVGSLGFSQTSPARPPHVDLVAVNQHTFRLSISFAEKPHAPGSLFVTAEAAKETYPSPAVKAGSWRGIKNNAGQLLIDRTAGSWMLKDRRGRVLIPVTAWATLGNDSHTGKPKLICPIGGSKEQIIYGSGDTNGGIVQTRGQSRVGNGITGVPYYWTNAG